MHAKKTGKYRECEVLPENKFKIMLDFCLVLLIGEFKPNKDFF